MRVKKVLCLSGSLRRTSANTAALLAAQRLAPAGLDLELYRGMAELPAFNPDTEALALPEPVARLRARVATADALLIACPEYAHGVPGAFKNLLDWLVGGVEFPHKPVLTLNISVRGSHHAQDALLEVLRTMSACLLSPEPLIVALPASGCSVADVLADPRRCAEIEAALSLLSPAG
ncbi:MAG: NAD(P)H-dependent oxidoreductase [Proteobacteria bacterium]|uniref:NADPH-dependent FMN reductase n=1 Tax=Rudaea sp. TaxID=2136325 RepID=UPI001D5B6689|nr:NAD(P)H-dependent oxidoreductase [Pseudomonadota bacterium]MBS0565986.1 NAD(P)H-dependent oxidoreductase [Pseudomonadota bacterium]